MQIDQGGPVTTGYEARLSAFQHDARTPLNVVLGYAQLMRTMPLPDEAQVQVDAILSAGRDLLQLLDRLDEDGAA